MDQKVVASQCDEVVEGEDVLSSVRAIMEECASAKEAENETERKGEERMEVSMDVPGVGASAKEAENETERRGEKRMEVSLVQAIMDLPGVGASAKEGKNGTERRGEEQMEGTGPPAETTAGTDAHEEEPHETTLARQRIISLPGAFGVEPLNRSDADSDSQLEPTDNPAASPYMVEARLVTEESDQQSNTDPNLIQANAVPVLESKFVVRLSCCGVSHLVNIPVLALILILLTGIVAAVTGAVRGSQDGPPSPAETQNENLSLTRFDSLRSFLSGQVTADGELFDDPKNPQYKALRWLADEDAAQITTDLDGELRVTQRYALAVLYFSTGGAQWEDSLNFLTEEHECEWQSPHHENGELRGVTECGALWGDGITTLALWWNNMTGTLPDEIGALTWLRSLTLGINNLHGTIPASLSSMNLFHLFMNNNNFEGTVPSELAALTDLETASLFSNPFLTGNVDLFCEGAGSREGLGLLWFSADCGGTSPTIDCKCCTNCCDTEASQCCDVGSNSSCWDPRPVPPGDDNQDWME